jgi:hypothetical protein
VEDGIVVVEDAAQQSKGVAAFVGQQPLAELQQCIVKIEKCAQQPSLSGPDVGLTGVVVTELGATLQAVLSQVSMRPKLSVAPKFVESRIVK